MMPLRKIKQPPPGEPKPPLTRLKELPPDARAKLMGILRANTYVQARPLVEAEVGFSCPVEALGRFFRWQAKASEEEAADDIAGEVEKFLRERHPDWTDAKLKELGGMFFMMKAIGDGDSRDFVRAAQVGLNQERGQLLGRRLNFEQEKLKWSQGHGETPSGMGALLEKYPEASELLEEMKRSLEGGGGGEHRTSNVEHRTSNIQHPMNES